MISLAAKETLNHVENEGRVRAQVFALSPVLMLLVGLIGVKRSNYCSRPDAV